MVDLAMFLWGWLLGAFLLGLGMGWIAVVRRGKTVSRALAQKLAALTVALIGLSLAKLLPGRFGYWLDLGLALFSFYLIGCAIGSKLRDWVVSRPAKVA
jgi:membrane protease YdiL (CAAX protease family)